MSGTLTIGRVAAIPIRLHWSWPLVFAATVAFVRPAYARAACGGPAVCGADLGLAALLATLVAASVLLHELGHALAARRVAVPVSAITLFPFGGAADLGADAPHPGAELLIALAGPAMSLLLAAAGGLVWWARGGLVAPDPLALVAAHVGLCNAAVALFNLLPSYPMDGGRVLRAALWFLDDDLLPATRLAAEVGRACGLSVALCGALVAFGARAPLVAVWAAVGGAVLFRAASASHRQALLQTNLRGVTVADLMQRRLTTVSAALTLEQFVARHVLGQSELSFAVVADAEQEDLPLAGLITLRDLRRFTMAQWSARRVADAMTPVAQVATIAPTTPVYDALFALDASRDGLLPVLDGPHMVGLLRQRDVALFVRMQMARRQHGR